jgi:hypothetical protein
MGEAVRKGDVLAIRHVLWGDVSTLQMGQAREGRRTDGLWRTTCFEAFVQPAGSAGYMELNAAPTGDWACYRFDAYRDGMRDADALLVLGRGEGEFTMRIDLGAVEGFAGSDWNVALAAVIEETGGAKSYWALKHPPGAPDFHDPDCFVWRLPAPEKP